MAKKAVKKVATPKKVAAKPRKARAPKAENVQAKKTEEVAFQTKGATLQEVQQKQREREAKNAIAPQKASKGEKKYESGEKLAIATAQGGWRDTSSEGA